MKNHVSHLAIISLLIISVSCSDKEKLPDYNEDQVNEWIYDTMKKEYYWNEDMKNPNYNLDTEAFFYSLLSGKDGKTTDARGKYYYSSINKKASSSKSYRGDGLSLGMQFTHYVDRDSRHGLKVEYIIPDSPAEKAGIKRGQWVLSINGQLVSSETVALLDTGTEVQLGLTGHLTDDPSSAAIVSLRAVSVYDNPVFLHKVITYENRRFAYLVYNHFTSGRSDETRDGEFDKALIEAVRELKSQSFDDFILDLRYNNGGLVTCAGLLASLLAPEEAKDDVFCKLKYDKEGRSDYTYHFDFSPGVNLNLSKLYIITSTFTASASEAVINGLKPFLGDNLVLVGDKTEGKNVGSVTFDDDKFEWELHPIVCRVTNKLGDEPGYVDYEEGFYPDYECKENVDAVWEDLGDENEYILNQLLEHITKGNRIVSLRSLTQSSGSSLVKLYNSFSAKRNGTIDISDLY